MAVVSSFTSDTKSEIADDFLENGYVVRPVDDRAMLDDFRARIAKIVCDKLGVDVPGDIDHFMNYFAGHCPIEKLNEVRLHTYRAMNAEPWFRPSYYAMARSLTETLVGNEVAMQNRVNLSIQLPDDDSSLLPIHADAFGGETPYQVVQWLPLVNCYGTKTMFILPRKQSEDVYADFTRYSDRGMDSLYEDVKDDLKWLDVPYGSVLIFSPNYLHGGVINVEKEARWSMNCRITGLFTPYTGAEKKLGSYYLPITTKPVTKIGLGYQEPSGFSE
ncbi:MAG: sporadic carbohydrate cluster 2OG-Fe(II) oxygenase [Pseudomonadota bacterium]